MENVLNYGTARRLDIASLTLLVKSQRLKHS